MTHNGLRHILASRRARKLAITNDSNTHQTSECEDDSINNEDEGPNVIVIKAQIKCIIIQKRNGEKMCVLPVDLKFIFSLCPSTRPK